MTQRGATKSWRAITMERNRTLPILLALIAIHVTLAALFASVTPYRTAGVLFGQRGQDGGPAPSQDIGAPDERQHVNYVARLLRGEGFPVFDPKDPNLYETYQSHQPPVFYVLAAAWSRVNGLSADDLTSPLGRDAGLRLRALNVVIGAATVAGVFFLAFWGFQRTDAALAAAAFAALLPMHAGLSGAVSNDPFLIALCTWTLALLAKGLRFGWSLGLGIAIGVLAGLAMLTKTTAVGLVPVLLYAAFAKQPSRPKASTLAITAIVLLAIAAPWWLRNQRLYGDPLAIRAFGEAFTGSAQASTFINSFGAPAYWVEWVGWWTARSLIGVFGYMDIWLTNTGSRTGQGGLYLLGLLLVVAGLIGWLMSLGRADADDRRVHLLNGVFLVVIVALFLRFNTQYFQAQARYLLPAIGPISVGVGIGLTRLLPRPAYALAAIALILGIADLFALSRLPTEFARRTAYGQLSP